MLAAVQNVEHRNRQGSRGHATNVAVERQFVVVRGSLGDRKRDAENRICAELCFVRRTVQAQEEVVDAGLVGGVQPFELWGDNFVDVLDRSQNALSAVAVLVAVAKLDGFKRAGARAAGYGRPSLAATLECDINFEGGVSTAVQNFPGLNF